MPVVDGQGEKGGTEWHRLAVLGIGLSEVLLKYSLEMSENDSNFCNAGDTVSSCLQNPAVEGSFWKDGNH